LQAMRPARREQRGILRRFRHPGRLAMSSRFCTQCGAQVQDDKRFCARCGKAVAMRAHSMA
jgi:ribosomal protein S27AE